MPIVNDPIDPGQVLEKLARLQEGIGRTVAREQELAKSREEQRVRVIRDVSAKENHDRQTLANRTEELRREHERRVERQQALYEKRRTWIQNAWHASRKALSARMQEEKDGKVRAAHGSMVADRQRRQKDLARAAEGHRAFKEVLAGDLQAREELKVSLKKALRSFAPLLLRGVDQIDKARVKTLAAGEPAVLREAVVADLEEAREAVAAAHRLPLAKLFRFLPWVVLAAIGAAVHVWLSRSGTPLMPGLAITEGAIAAAWLVALGLSWSTGRRAVAALLAAKEHAAAARMLSSARVADLKTRVEKEEHDQNERISEVFGQTDAELRAQTVEAMKKVDARHARIPAKHDQLHQRNLANLKRRHEAALGMSHSDSAEMALTRSHERDDAMAVIERAINASISELVPPWEAAVVPLKAEVDALAAPAEARYPAWTQEQCERWAPPEETPAAIRIGHLQVDLAKQNGGIPKSPRLPLPGEAVLQVPLALGFPQHGSLMIETTGDPATAIAAINGIALRLFASLPPGRASFVFIDPVGLGRGFAGLMHLADYEETLITNRIWTQTTQIEERLAELCEHIEKVIQMYLRNEYATIADYNAQAGSVAEKYRFLVIGGFPAAFSETASKRLRSIAASGARCGVHLLIQCDLRQQTIDPGLDEELRRACLRVTLDHGKFHLADPTHAAHEVVFDTPPSDEDMSTLIHRIGQASIDSNRVQVPFSHITPPVAERWTLDTSEELRVPIGRAGAKKLQMLAIGKGTRQHMLVAGKTGSGKSTLFHVIITNLALWCSPEQVEFYLVDFKKGVEFKCYGSKHLPHARVVAIESDREFALSVLQQVDQELRRRGELFRKGGSQDLASYNRNGSPLPRTLLLIDEFQEFFTEDDAVAQEASLLLDRIVRQGRAFGIHVILGSQTLGGAYTLARATLGQMVIRVALQCNEADAHLIMDEDNPAPRLLTRPGEGIYNDQAGALAANSPFQIVWLAEQERDKLLDEVAALARQRAEFPAVPIVFEGNAPAEIRDNVELAAALRNRPSQRPAAGRAWLGAPNSIKGPTEARFQRQSGSHLLVVGQSGERTFSLLLVSILSLASQYPAGQAEFVILDPNAAELPGEESFQALTKLLPHKVSVGGPAEVAALMTEVNATLESRAAGASADAPEVFVIVRDLQRFKALRPEDDFRFSMDDDASSAANPSQVFSNLLNEGGPAGMHVITSTDTWNNVSRWIPRKLMAEFEMRVLFQMSANDSANLIDGPAASALGLHRALFHNEHLGSDETFRPYALPDEEWLEEAAAKFRE
ncbi:FtsK/SpoIIIE domain-containing protein [Luteolibacter sp. LG18]|uniref:FtsK/SpoIIIE domain-containing protein n=1 Tax=Luteolibacter sp. LG18 TaxID=2819286 RepID=UPI002B28A86F|nr:hypothetical protein llg_17310 [Luteolibacter sp. LG18]